MDRRLAKPVARQPAAEATLQRQACLHRQPVLQARWERGAFLESGSVSLVIVASAASKRHFPATWMAMYKGSPEATQVHLAEDGKARLLR